MEEIFMTKNINDSITRYNELLKLTTGKSEDYATRCLIDYDWYLKDFNIVAVDLSHQAVLDSNPKSSQQIEFVYKILAGTEASILTVLEKEKQTKNNKTSYLIGKKCISSSWIKCSNVCRDASIQKK